MVKAIILADTAKAYKDYLQVYRLKTIEYPWVHDIESLKGFKNRLLLRTGEWYLVLDKEMLDYMESHGIDMVTGK